MSLKKAFFTIAALTSILLISCGGEDESPTTIALPDASTVPLVSSPDSQTALTNSGLSPTGNAGVALNPAHGQPGHRCEIAVGAPLNSLPNAAASPLITPPASTTIAPASTTIAPISTASVPALTPTNTATLKFNPKHGEPGHRCELAVGAPLDGKKQ